MIWFKLSWLFFFCLILLFGGRGQFSAWGDSSPPPKKKRPAGNPETAKRRRRRRRKKQNCGCPFWMYLFVLSILILMLWMWDFYKLPLSPLSRAGKWNSLWKWWCKHQNLHACTAWVTCVGKNTPATSNFKMATLFQDGYHWCHFKLMLNANMTE